MKMGIGRVALISIFPHPIFVIHNYIYKMVQHPHVYSCDEGPIDFKKYTSQQALIQLLEQNI